MPFEELRLKPETARETIETITLAEYQNLPPEIKEWLQMNEEVPEIIWKKLCDLDPSITLLEALEKIREAFSEAMDHKKPSSPTSFEDSRFSTFHEIIARKLNSCGIRARVYGTVLRRLGVPVRFVDGKYEGQEQTTDHAWLDIYSPNEKAWLECDPGDFHFKNDTKNRRERIFHDWDELKAVHEKR
jgi:hypothetical protein